MFASDLISNEVPTLSRADQISDALKMMNDFHTNVLPLVENEQYDGLIDENRLLAAEPSETSLAGIPLSVLKPAIQSDVYLFEAIKLIGNYKLSLLPVIDGEARYLGSITQEKLLTALSQFNSISQPGGILILEMKPSDYMLSEIAKLAEAQDIYILGVHTISEPESNKLTIILKTNHNSLATFASSLKQLNYNIISRIDETENPEGLRKNYDLLMNYINM